MRSKVRKRTLGLLICALYHETNYSKHGSCANCDSVHGQHSISTFMAYVSDATPEHVEDSAHIWGTYLRTTRGHHRVFLSFLVNAFLIHMNAEHIHIILNRKLSKRKFQSQGRTFVYFTKYPPYRLFGQDLAMSSDFETATERSTIVDAVGACITNVNDITQLLQINHPITSNILEAAYPDNIVQDFVRISEQASKNLQHASNTASTWLTAISDRISENLVKAQQVNADITQTSSRIGQTQERIVATQERINQAGQAVARGRENRAAALRELGAAEDRLDRRRSERNVVRAAGFLTFFIPVLSVGLLAISLTAMEDAVDSQRDVVRSVEDQCRRDEQELGDQSRKLQEEQDAIARISAEKSSLELKKNALTAETDTLDKNRVLLSSVSVKINNCLYTVNCALGSANALGTSLSLSNVPVSIVGLLEALRAESMFAGPLAQFRAISFEELDRRIASIKTAKGRLAV